MPTRRFSTRSSRPTPCAPATRLSVSTISTGPRRRAVERDRHALFEGQRDLLGLVGGVERVDGQLEHALLGAVPDVLEVAALVGEVPDVAVAAEDVARRVLDRDVVLRGVVERVLAGADVPLPPRRDHPEVRRERPVGHLEADLIVALAGGAVGERVGALLQRDLRPGGRRGGAGPAPCREGSGPRRSPRRRGPCSSSRGRTPRGGPSRCTCSRPS